VKPAVHAEKSIAAEVHFSGNWRPPSVVEAAAVAAAVVAVVAVADAVADAVSVSLGTA